MKRIIVLIMCCGVIGIFLYILYYPVKLEVDLISVYMNQNPENHSYWKTVCSENDNLLSEIVDTNVESLNIDFNQYNLIISYENEIKSISYKRISRFQNPLKDKPYLGKAEYGNYNKDSIYLYRIKKVNVIYDIFTDII